MIQINGLKDHITKILERNFEISRNNFEEMYSRSVKEYFTHLEPEIEASIKDVLLDMTSMLKYTMSEMIGFLTGDEAYMLGMILRKTLYTPEIDPSKFLLGIISDYIDINKSFNYPDDPSLAIRDKVRTLTKHQCYALIIATYNGFESDDELAIIKY